jgi:hypothetical protein
MVRSFGRRLALALVLAVAGPLTLASHRGTTIRGRIIDPHQLRPGDLTLVHLDHVPIAVRDLQSAEKQFGSLGFTIKPGRPHQNGIENCSIKFADGSYIELITSHNGTDAVAREYQQFLKTGEGASYVFLRDRDGAFADQVRGAGGRREEAGPFAFTELPASWRAPHLQVIEYLAPAVDRPETYQHANGARRVVAVWMFDVEGPLGTELGARSASVNEFAFDERATRTVALAENTRLLLTPRGPQDPPGALAAAILIEVDSLARLKEFTSLERAVSRGPVLWLPPSTMHGVWLGFVERATWR